MNALNPWHRERGVFIDLADALLISVDELPWWRWRARRRLLIAAEVLIAFVHEGDTRA